MREPVAATAFRGRTASIGFARGPFVRLETVAAGARDTGLPHEEKLTLNGALASAGQQIGSLARAVGGEAAQILEFQAALLEDEDFIEPIFAAVQDGAPAEVAWSAALDEQIADYTAAADEYLRARSADLIDLRDRVLRLLGGGGGEQPAIPPGAVICADDLPPSQFLEIDWSGGGGLALLHGSPTSHVAMLARARGIPMVVQFGSLPADAQIALLDGENATIELDPASPQLDRFERRREAHTRNRAAARAILRRPTADWRGDKIRLLINIQHLADLDHADADYADGIGLMRTEFLLSLSSGLPDEESQYRVYDEVLRWAGKRPVTIRTFDAGGDKPVAGFTMDNEANPFLGVRGLRLCLRKPEIFKVQLRALARAAVHGNLKVMFPMVTLPEEFEAGRALMMDAVRSLQDEGVACALPPIGLMVEVPAAALTIEQFKASFCSIGSNDLAQYVLACDRGNGALDKLADPLHAAVLELIRRTADGAKRAGSHVSLCGDMAGDPRCVPALLACGVRELSVNPSALAQIKQTLNSLSSGSAA